MSVFVASADLHIHNYSKFDNGENQRLKNCLRALSMMFAVADKVGAREVVIAGDFLERTGTVPSVVAVQLASTLTQLFLKHPTIDLILITGNHDLYAKTGAAAGYSVLEMLPVQYPGRCFLIDNQTYHSKAGDIVYYGVPYYQEPEDLYQTVDAIQKVPGDKYHVLVVHATVSGFDGVPGTVDATHKCFSRWDLVISGDIHKRRVCADRFYMLGNPLHKDLSDEGDEKGIWVFEAHATTDPRFIPIGNHFPQFKRVRVKMDANGKVIMPENPNGDYLVPEVELPENTLSAEASTEESFHASVAPEKLLTEYYKATGQTDKDLLSYGLSLLTPITTATE